MPSKLKIHNAVKFIVREHNDSPGVLVIVALVDDIAVDERIVAVDDTIAHGQAINTMYTAHKKDIYVNEDQF